MSKWDLYDDKFNNTGIVINDTDEIPDGKYHYSINVWILNSKKQLLLIRNTLNYNIHYPGFWSSINGNVLSGESSTETCIKTINSKIGIKITDSEMKTIDKKLRDPYHYIYETYIVNKDIDLNEICFIDNTAVQAKWIDLKELYNMIENGEIAWVLIPRIEEYVIPLMKETN